MILRRKTIFLGPLNSYKSMLGKFILIGLFVLNNNRTIGLKYLQGGKGREDNCPRMLFYCRFLPAWEIGGGFLQGQLRLAQECTAGRVVGGERAEFGRGLCKFASHQDVLTIFLKNNCLKVQVFLS